MTGLSTMPRPSLLRRPNSSLITQFAACLASRPFATRLEIIGGLTLGDQHVGVVGREPVIGDETRALGIGKLRQVRRERIHIGLRQFERQEVRIGEIAIIVRLFLGAHRPRLAGLGVEQARLLVDRAALLDDLDLAARLVFDGLADEADRVDVLDLAARAERSRQARRTDTLTSARSEPCSMLPSQVPR